MNLLWPIALQILAFAVAFAEVIVPSFGILLALCLGLAGYSWYLILHQLPHQAAIWFGIADLAAIPIFLKFSFSYLGRSSISHRTDLGSGSGLEEGDKRLQAHIGEIAKVDATLRPTGRIRIGEDTYEAQTLGEWVEKGGSVKIVSVSGSRFHVEKLPNP